MHVSMSLPTPPPPGDSRTFDHFICKIFLPWSIPHYRPGVGGVVGSDIDRCITMHVIQMCLKLYFYFYFFTDRTIICPRCRVVTDVPRMGGIYVLPVNLDLQEAIEGMRDFFDMGLALVPADPGRPPTPPPPRITPENEREYVTIGRIQNPPRMQVLVRVPVKNWYEVGLHLSLPEHELHSIEINNHRQKEICPREMFTFWLRYIPGASYEDLHMAMELVGEKPVLPLTPPKGPVTFATKSKSAKKRASE